MIGFPGEDYTTPQTIHATGGFGDPATRAERLKVLEWAVARARQLGQTLLTFHAGFIPPVGDPGRKAFLDTLAHAGDLCRAAGITAGLETGQETADLLKTTLEELRHPAVKVNFDPANMILYDMGDPVAAVGKLGPYIASVHAKDAIRTTVPGTWGQEVPLGQGQVNFPAFISALKSAGYRGPLIVEREVGDQAGRLADIIHGVRFLRGLGVG
jgi:sugar phosphate isomerase/epimerase